MWGLDDLTSFPTMIGSDYCIVVVFVLDIKKIFFFLYIRNNFT